MFSLQTNDSVDRQNGRQIYESPAPPKRALSHHEGRQSPSSFLKGSKKKNEPMCVSQVINGIKCVTFVSPVDKPKQQMNETCEKWSQKRSQNDDNATATRTAASAKKAWCCPTNAANNFLTKVYKEREIQPKRFQNSGRRSPKRFMEDDTQNMTFTIMADHNPASTKRQVFVENIEARANRIARDTKWEVTGTMTLGSPSCNDVVIVKPIGMTQAPPVMALRNPKGEINVLVISNKDALFKVEDMQQAMMTSSYIGPACVDVTKIGRRSDLIDHVDEARIHIDTYQSVEETVCQPFDWSSTSDGSCNYQLNTAIMMQHERADAMVSPRKDEIQENTIEDAVVCHSNGLPPIIDLVSPKKWKSDMAASFAHRDVNQQDNNAHMIERIPDLQTEFLEFIADLDVDLHSLLDDSAHIIDFLEPNLLIKYTQTKGSVIDQIGRSSEADKYQLDLQKVAGKDENLSDVASSVHQFVLSKTWDVGRSFDLNEECHFPLEEPEIKTCFDEEFPL